jgi:tRNA 2-thiouridine synthesizing protein E
MLQTPRINYLKEAIDSTSPYAIYTRSLEVDGREILTDPEGYILDMDAWSEAFAEAQAAREGLTLTEEHWQVIRFIRDYYEEHNVQAQVRDMVMHFRKVWGPERGNSRYLHDIFPMGGPQKQGNRVAGMRKTKGEH